MCSIFSCDDTLPLLEALWLHTKILHKSPIVQAYNTQIRPLIRPFVWRAIVWCVYICMYIRTYIYTHTHARTHTYMYICVCIRTYMYTYTHKYIYSPWCGVPSCIVTLPLLQASWLHTKIPHKSPIVHTHTVRKCAPSYAFCVTCNRVMMHSRCSKRRGGTHVLCKKTV